MSGCDAISPQTLTSSPACSPMSTTRRMRRSTAGCSGVNRLARLAFPRSTARVYWTRSLVPMLRNATSAARVSAATAAAGVSTITPSGMSRRNSAPRAANSLGRFGHQVARLPDLVHETMSGSMMRRSP